VHPQDPSPQYVGARHRHRGRSTPGGIELEHGHGHGPAAPADRRVRFAVAALLVPALLATVVGLIVLYPFEDRRRSAQDPSVRISAHVTAATEVDCADGQPGGSGCLALTTEMSDGPRAGQSIVTLVSVVRGKASFGVGDE
jgi:UPF0716 family protein affecting phage T7 exclusion